MAPVLMPNHRIISGIRATAGSGLNIVASVVNSDLNTCDHEHRRVMMIAANRANPKPATIIYREFKACIPKLSAVIWVNTFTITLENGGRMKAFTSPRRDDSSQKIRSAASHNHDCTVLLFRNFLIFY
jgi:hypothetical protein